MPQTWNPRQYEKFTNQRRRAALDLLDRIPLAAPSLIYDLGCGPGDITRTIAERWPQAAVVGIDSSAAMIDRAVATPSIISWRRQDLREWTPDENPALIFSNAALHWVDGHAPLLTRWMDCLRPGGCLAVQMPLTWHEPSHRLMRDTLADGGPHGTPLGSESLRREVAQPPVAAARSYYDLLAGASRSLDIWETRYLHVLDGSDPVLEWVKGTGLKPVLDALDDRERDVFLARYAERLRVAYPPRPDGHTLYPFPRLFIVTVR